MKRTKYSIFIILFALLCPSCNSRKKSSHNDREIIAELGEEVLYTDELNTIIKQELFDELNKIYEIKKKAVEQLINVKLLQKAKVNRKQILRLKANRKEKEKETKKGKDKAKPKMNGRRIESSRPFRQTAFFRLRLLLSKVCL